MKIISISLSVHYQFTFSISFSSVYFEHSVEEGPDSHFTQSLFGNNEHKRTKKNLNWTQKCYFFFLLLLRSHFLELELISAFSQSLFFWNFVLLFVCFYFSICYLSKAIAQISAQRYSIASTMSTGQINRNLFLL